MPVNEGIAYPVDDESLRPMHYHLYGGHGLCMAWYGVTDLDRGLMTLVETPDDAAVNVPRQEGRLHLAPEWEPQQGEFGYARRLRYVAFDRGGYVAMAKRHREHAKATGLLQDLGAETPGKPERRPADRRGQRVGLRHGRREALPGNAVAGHPTHLVERRRQARATGEAQRDGGRADQPLRHLSRLHGSGQFPQAPQRARRLDLRGLAART